MDHHASCLPSQPHSNEITLRKVLPECGALQVCAGFDLPTIEVGTASHKTPILPKRNCQIGGIPEAVPGRPR